MSSQLKKSLQCFTPPSYVDPKISFFFNSLKEKIIINTNKKIVLKKRFNTVVCWENCDFLPKMTSYFHYIINASVTSDQFEANKMAKLSEAFLSKKTILNNNMTLKKLLLKLQKTNYKKVNIFGSGPSLSQYKKFDFQNSLSIICNSIVKNTELLKDIRPQIIVATDSVFHSGYSKYASEFRYHLCKALDLIEEMVFLVPMRDLNIYHANLPHIYKSRILGIESSNLVQYNVDLLESPVLRSTSNVLTFFLLPIAATLSKEIYLLGFDGNGTDKKNIFWNYDKESQFIKSIDYTKLAHPAFYTVDYDLYHNIHASEIKALLDKVEKKGIKVKNLVRSYIPILDNYND